MFYTSHLVGISKLGKKDDYRVSANAANHSADRQMIVVTNEQDKLIDKEFEPGENEACCHVQ